MKCLTLCAGYGTRLGELTKNRPKPTIEINGRSIIDHIVSKLHIHGITEIIVNLHYLQDMMINHLQDNVLYFYEPRLLGHKGTILALRNWLKDDDFFVINGDTLSALNYTSMIKAHKNGTITAFMDEYRCAGTWIYSPLYFEDQNIPIYPYRDLSVKWFDIGNPTRLEEAKKYYETTYIVSNVSK